MIRITESPREAWQSLPQMIPTGEKVAYITRLLKAGFHLVEAGSFVSPKLIPQMADSAEVLGKLDPTGTETGVMVLTVNRRGMDLAGEIDQVSHISYPFSISPFFQKQNLNTTQEEGLALCDHLMNTCTRKGKTPVLYYSMAFGNPFGDSWSTDLLADWTGTFERMGFRHIPLSNVSVPLQAEQTASVFGDLISAFPGLHFGLHLHTGGTGWEALVDAALNAGCTRFDTVMEGLGGCPMTEKLGNLDTMKFLDHLDRKGLSHGIRRPGEETMGEDRKP